MLIHKSGTLLFLLISAVFCGKVLFKQRHLKVIQKSIVGKSTVNSEIFFEEYLELYESDSSLVQNENLNLLSSEEDQTDNEEDEELTSDEENSLFESIWKPYNDCGDSKRSHLVNLTISGCSDSDSICVVHLGKPLRINIAFIPKQRATNLWCSLVARKGLIHKNIRCPQSDACNAPGIHCPLQIGKVYNYSVTSTLSGKIPKWKYWIKGMLKDQNGNIMMCVDIHVKVAK